MRMEGRRYRVYAHVLAHGVASVGCPGAAVPAVVSSLVSSMIATSFS